MKYNIRKSLRVRLLVYSVGSLFLTLCSEFLLGVGVYNLARILGVSRSGYGIQKKVIYPPQEIRYKKNFLLHLTSLWRIDNNTLITLMVFIVVTGFLLFAFYFLLLSRNVTRDLTYIANRINEMSDGNLEDPLEMNREDEIGEIACKINEMTEQIKQLMAAEREALQTNKDMIACVAHDLRTPLTSVTGYLQLAMDVEKYSVEQRQKYAAIALQKANRLEGLIQDLFNYTKLMSGEISLHRSPTDLVMLVEQMVDEFYPQFHENNLAYNVSKNVDKLVLNIDPELIARAVQNLISNAVKYGKDGKQIIIVLERLEKEVQIRVTNFGLIIPEDSLSLIFEKFYRVEESRSRQTGGTGLGLNITREIMILHDGRIHAESGKQGTVFTIALPLENQKEVV